jgi:hypothetical protein
MEKVLFANYIKIYDLMIIELQCDLDMILDQFLSSDLGYDLNSKIKIKVIVPASGLQSFLILFINGHGSTFWGIQNFNFGQKSSTPFLMNHFVL